MTLVGTTKLDSAEKINLSCTAQTSTYPGFVLLVDVKLIAHAVGTIHTQ